MKIKDILKGMQYEILHGSDKLEVDHLSWDSRKVQSHSLFICTKGRNVDRHTYALQAVQKGAIAVLVEQTVPSLPKDITVIRVHNTRVAMAAAANNFYHEPSKRMNMIGITGTNGKTSTTYFIEKILQQLGRKVGIIGTIENKLGEHLLTTEKLNPTTPDAIELQSLLSEMANLGATDIAMEVTSTALEQHRVDYCDFDIGVFTNLTQDHLEDHGTMENYKKAKMKLFQMCRLGIVNIDDPVSEEIRTNASCDVITYGIDREADFQAKAIQYTPDGIIFTLDFHGSERKVKMNILGKFNVYNILAAIAVCYFLGFPLSLITDSLAFIHGIRGRFEAVPNQRGFSVIVDYAHTPDGLENILSSVRDLHPHRVLVVFGCGGERDQTKRPIMGTIAGIHADYCIITSDNPRRENPEKIIAEIETGIKLTLCPYNKISNRKEAIHFVLEKAQPGDIIVVAGKGQENYQVVGENKLPFDDVETIKRWLEMMAVS